METYKVGSTYLVKFNTHSDVLISMMVLLETEKAFHVRWNNGQNSNEQWLDKKTVNDYIFVEDITSFMKNDNKWGSVETKKVKTSLIPCFICKGFGTIPDTSSTAGNKICPRCNGAKMIELIVGTNN